MLDDILNSFTIPEVADVLGVTRVTVYRWVKGEGVAEPLPAIKLGGNYRITEDALETWIKNNQ